MERADLLIEIGTEEIPAGYVDRAVERLRERVLTFLRDNGIESEAEGAKIFATPRRLAVRVPAVALTQKTRTERKLGPAVKAAFDEDGKPRPAAEGFARSVGLPVEKLEREKTDKGERLAANVTTGGATLRELLLAGEFLREQLELGFPKTMRWFVGDSFAFARPIRWIVVLLGDESLPLRLASLVAGNESRGHRTLAPGPVTIERPSDYESALSAAQVEVRPQARRELIEREAMACAKQVGGTVHRDDGLLDEVVHLVEHPHPVLGSFDEQVAKLLPKEIIITAMRSHQRYFSVEDSSGGLLPHFITFRDGGEQGIENVREGNERVLRARLDDATFYWNEDRSLSSEDKLARLDRIVWIEGLGSMKAKSERIRLLALALRGELMPATDEATVSRGALLCKTDLATEMIRDGKEFTKLQGVMGRYYALEAGETAAVATVIEEHLKPLGSGSDLPMNEEASLVALADRLDTVAGCMLAGFAPTGSADPYGLRRAAFAVLRILAERNWSLDLMAWSDHALEQLSDDAEKRRKAHSQVADLFWGRLESQLDDLAAEIVRAVLSVATLDPIENVRSARALASFAQGEDFNSLLVGAKRCRNILVKEGRLPEEELEGEARASQLRERAAAVGERWQRGAGFEFDPKGLVEAAESALWEAAKATAPRLGEAAAAKDPDRVYAELAGLGAPISRFFDEVLVNVDDEALRTNRLAFLEHIHYLFAQFADLSRIPSR